jgi:hypothetical protein
VFGQMGEVGHGAVDRASRVVEIPASHQRCGTRQTTASALANSEHHIQIAQKLFR